MPQWLACTSHCGVRHWKFTPTCCGGDQAGRLGRRWLCFFLCALALGFHSPLRPRVWVPSFLQSLSILVWVASRSFRVAGQKGWDIPELGIRAGMSNFSGTLEDSDSQAPGVWLPYTNVRVLPRARDDG